jgi:ribosomal RNA-processing protein 12
MQPSRPRTPCLFASTAFAASPISFRPLCSLLCPLSERMFNLQQKAETEGVHQKRKVWSVLIAQDMGWPCRVLSFSCRSQRGELLYAGKLAPLLVRLHSFSGTHSGVLSITVQLLYGQPELRPSVLKALKVMVDSNVSPSLTDAQSRLKMQIRM